MDLATVIGLVLAWGAITVGFLMEGGRLGSMVSPSAAMIVLGGSAGATMLSFALHSTTGIGTVLRNAFFLKHTDRLSMLRTIVDLAKRARQAGILALESEARDIQNPFLSQAIRLVVDGTQPELTREILLTEIDAMRARHKVGQDFFAQWGGFCPTLGIIGTVMGLVHMLENLSDPGGMGPAIATAFIATLYGIAFANLFLLPMANKLKHHSHEETTSYEMAVEGVLSLQAGDNPRVVATKMRAFLSPGDKRRLDAEDM